jgi:hypothetical protein
VVAPVLVVPRKRSSRRLQVRVPPGARAALRPVPGLLRRSRVPALRLRVLRPAAPQMLARVALLQAEAGPERALQRQAHQAVLARLEVQAKRQLVAAVRPARTRVAAEREVREARARAR